VTFTNWAGPDVGGWQEPNNLWSSGEHFAHMNWVRPGLWNDLGPASPEWRGLRHAIIEKADDAGGDHD
jgi:hypothetical protein